MDSGLYAAYTGLLARSQSLEAAANNVANAGTTGFRAQRDIFRGVLATAINGDGQGFNGSGFDGSGFEMPGNSASAAEISGAVNSYGVLAGTHLDTSQGLLSATGNPLDVALRGPGFFQVAAASGKVELTRDGSFLRASDGTLTTRSGDAVLNTAGKKIVLPPGKVEVAPDGTISVTNEAGTAIGGTIGVVNYPAALLTPMGLNRFVAAAGARPLPQGDTTLQQGMLEGSNEDAVHGTMQLLLVQRQAEMMQRAVNVFANDMDKTAAEQLGRV